MKKRSRNYARRQLTWMRKIPNLHRIDRTAAPTPRPPNAASWPPRVDSPESACGE